MTRLLQNFNKQLKKRSLFDYVMIGLFVILGASAFLFFFKKSAYVTVRLRITDRDAIYINSNPPSWFVYQFKKGMREKNALGQTTAEILDVYYYDSLSDLDARISKKTIYLTIRLKSSYNSRTGEYKYNGINVAAGEVLRINFGSILAHGLITDVEGVKNPYQTVNIIVKTQIKTSNPVFLGTTGVDPYWDEALSVGDKVIDSAGNTAAEIIAKEVSPAKTVTTDNFGNLRQYMHPRKKDIFLTLRLTAKKVGNELFYFDDFPVKVGYFLPLYFPKASLYAAITAVAFD
ncbi:MAG: DUF4330 family protein [Patescibacteria group bacterium]